MTDFTGNARKILVVDGLGCAAAAGLAAIPALYRAVDPRAESRPLVVLGLSATSLVCLLGVRSPEAPALRTAAAVNAGWVAVCLRVLPRQRSRFGRALVLGTAVVDAAAGYAQLRLSRR